jgi:hypothetical protein
MPQPYKSYRYDPDRNVPDPATLHAPDPLDLGSNQPDPTMSVGRMGSGGMSFIALAVVAILALVVYGLNGRSGPAHPNISNAPPIQAPINRPSNG